jgi:hypothetical protein
MKRLVSLRLSLALCALAPPADAQAVVNSVFTADGFSKSYGDANNWSPPEVPNNSATRTYNVTIPDVTTPFYYPSGVHLDVDATISNLSLSGQLYLQNHSLTVASTTTTARDVDLYLVSSPGAPVTFAAGNLTACSNGSLSGTFRLWNDNVFDTSDSTSATLEFNGANVIRLVDAQVYLYGAHTRIVDEAGNNGLRNLTRIDRSSSLWIFGQDFVTAGTFTNNGSVLMDSGSFTITGRLTNFDSVTRTLTSGSYDVGAGELRFPGADIVNNAGTIAVGADGKIVDQQGRDALRNFSNNKPGAVFRLYGAGEFVTAGDFRNDGLVSLEGTLTVSGSLTNFDPTARRLAGGQYEFDGGTLQFTGADIVHNAASFHFGRNGGWVADENNEYAFRNFSHNEPQGRIFSEVGFSAGSSDFINEGSMTIFSHDGPGYFSLPEGRRYVQAAGETIVGYEIFFGADVSVDGGVFHSAAELQRDVNVGAGVLSVSDCVIDGSLRLSPNAGFRCFFEPSGIAAGISGPTTIIDGQLEIDDRNAFPPLSSDVTTVLKAYQTNSITGTFRNAPPGGRVTTMSGRGSFLVTYRSDGISLSDYHSVVPPAHSVNISARGRVGTRDQIMIGGFIIAGRESKKVLLRGIGPSLSAAGVGGLLQDPTLELRDATGAIIAASDNWREAEVDVEATGLPPGDDRESALVRTLDPGTYTVLLRGRNDTTGVGLVEVYDLQPDTNSELANTSTRGFVDADNLLIGGTIVGGSKQGDAYLVVRAIGGELAVQGVANPLGDPAVELRDRNGMLVAANDDFSRPSTDRSGMPYELSPTGPFDAAIALYVAPGEYTAIVRGKRGASGIALVEIYDLDR